jgi:Zn-dependent peptidase ImmA (M78 family)
LIKYDINPFEIILEVVNRCYPTFDAKISFVPEEDFEEMMKRWGATDTEVKEACGVTMFDDECKTTIICINASIPCYAAVEVIAHEVAHVVAGVDAEHGEKWENEFNKIHIEYSKSHSEMCEKM